MRHDSISLDVGLLGFAELLAACQTICSVSYSDCINSEVLVSGSLLPWQMASSTLRCSRSVRTQVLENWCLALMRSQRKNCLWWINCCQSVQSTVKFRKCATKERFSFCASSMQQVWTGKSRFLIDFPGITPQRNGRTLLSLLIAK